MHSALCFGLLGSDLCGRRWWWASCFSFYFLVSVSARHCLAKGGEIYLQTCFMVEWDVLGLGREMRYVGRGFAAWGKTFSPRLGWNRRRGYPADQ